MSSTPISAYYEAISKGFLPASVPIITNDGEPAGLATTGYGLDTVEAQRLTAADDWHVRAEAAIIVCAQSRRSVNARFEELTSP